MSKNTSSSQFRKIDIDAFNDEDVSNLNDDQNDNVNELGPNEGEIKRLLDGKKNVEALVSVLKSAPLNTKNQDVKDAAFQVLLNVLRSFSNSSDIESAVKSLDMDSIDILMKYIYRGFEAESKFSNVFLNWHEKVYSVGGSGCIIRVLSDRKRV